MILLEADSLENVRDQKTEDNIMKYETCSDYKNDVVESMIHYAKAVQLRKKLNKIKPLTASEIREIKRYQ